MLMAIFWDHLAVGVHSPLQQAARIACPFLHDNALANAIERLPMLLGSDFANDDGDLDYKRNSLPRMSAAQLAKYNGVSDKKTFLGFDGIVYDVTSAHTLFGPSGEFRVLAGRHATRAILMSSILASDANTFIDDLNVPPHASQATAKVLSSRFTPVAAVEE